MPMNTQTQQKLGELFGKASAIAKNCGTGAGGFKPGNACGRGGSGSGENNGSGNAKPQSPGLGGSPGGKDSYNDRIEGTQKEADREVKRADKAVQVLKGKLASAEKRRTASRGAIKQLKAAYSELEVKKNGYKKEMTAAQSRIAELKKQLAESRARVAADKPGANPFASRGGLLLSQKNNASVMKSIDKELDAMQTGIKGLRAVTQLAEKLAKKADSL